MKKTRVMSIVNTFVSPIIGPNSNPTIVSVKSTPIMLKTMNKTTEPFKRALAFASLAPSPFCRSFTYRGKKTLLKPEAVNVIANVMKPNDRTYASVAEEAPNSRAMTASRIKPDNFKKIANKAVHKAAERNLEIANTPFSYKKKKPWKMHTTQSMVSIRVLFIDCFFINRFVGSSCCKMRVMIDNFLTSRLC